MNDEKLLEFLKGYAEFLRTDVDLSPIYPLKYWVSMPGGCIKLMHKEVTKEGFETNNVGYISIQNEPTCPSMPIGPASISLAKLLTSLFNAYMEYTKKKTT